MIPFSAEVGMTQVDTDYCTLNSHFTPKTWDANGDGVQVPMRFYELDTTNPLLNKKVACECCVVLANYYVNLMKNGR